MRRAVWVRVGGAAAAGTDRRLLSFCRWHSRLDPAALARLRGAAPAACGIRWRDEQLREEAAAFAAAPAGDASAASSAADDAYVQAGGGGWGGQRAGAAGLGGAVATALGPAIERQRGLPRGRASLRGATGSWRCQRCLKCVTPCHRPGPGGKGTLCNGTCAGGMRREGAVGWRAAARWVGHPLWWSVR